MKERILKVSKRALMRDAPCPNQTQAEEGSEGKNNGDETLRENTEHFFVTQVWTVFLILTFQGFKALLGLGDINYFLPRHVL